MLKRITAAALAAFALAGTVTAQPQATPAPARDYTVFVDLPTGFTFVKLPQGWKFAGKVAERDLARLPGTVVTTLLEPDATRVAARGARAAPLD